MNLPAQSLRRGHSGSIGLAVPDLINPYFAALVQGVIQHAEARSIKVFIELTGGSPDREIAVLTDPLRSMTDGLILALTGVRHGEDEARLNADFPLVVLGDQPFGNDITQVTMSNEQAASAATQYLIDRGARRIALLGWHPGKTATSVLRFEGYCHALSSNGIEFSQDLILVEGDWTRDQGAKTIYRALDQKVEFDAVFTMNDVLAVGALHALTNREIAVPSQVQVIGFDNLVESAYTHPPLTTVDPSIDRIAEDAVKTLIDKIDTRGSDADPVHIYEPFKIVARGSTRE